MPHIYRKGKINYNEREVKGVRILTYVAQDKDANRRVGAVLKGEMRLSRSLISPLKFHDGIWLDGRIIRTDARMQPGQRLEVRLRDEGETWSEPVPSPFTAPDSPMCVKKLKNGKFFAVWNPIPVYNGRSKPAHGIWTGGRSPLLFAVLNENGDFNLEHTVVEDDDSAGFCYCAIYETDNGDILLGYCAGGQEDGGCLNKLRIRKIPKTDFAE